MSLAIHHLQWDYFFPLRGSFSSVIPVPRHVSFFIQLRKIPVADQSPPYMDDNDTRILLDTKEVMLSDDRLSGQFSLTLPFVYNLIRYGRTHQVVLFCRTYLEDSQSYEYYVTENSLPFYIRTSKTPVEQLFSLAHSICIAGEHLYTEEDRFFTGKPTVFRTHTHTHTHAHVCMRVCSTGLELIFRSLYLVRDPQITVEDVSMSCYNKKMLDTRCDSMTMEPPYIYPKSKEGISVKFEFHDQHRLFGSLMTVRLLKNCVEQVPDVRFQLQPSSTRYSMPTSLSIPIADWRTGIYCWAQDYSVDHDQSVYLSRPFQIRCKCANCRLDRMLHDSL
jgi:hypothetical protein